LDVNWLDNFLMNSFPGLRDWARDQSDQLSRSFGRPATGSTYVLSTILDVLLGLVMIGVVWFLHTQRADWEWFDENRAFNVLQFVGFGRQGAANWAANLVYAVIYGIPLVICGLYSSRPVRFGLAVTVLLFMHLVMFPARREHEILFQGRTYFGVLRVLKADERLFHFNAQREPVPNDKEEWDNFAVPPTMVRRWNHLKGNSLQGRRVVYIHLPVTPTINQLRQTSAPKPKGKNSLRTASDSALSRHKVKPGETLTSIASTHHTTVAALKRANRDVVTLRPGMILLIKDVR